MSERIVRHRERIESVSYSLSFDHYSFDCDNLGRVLTPLNPAAQANYDRLIAAGHVGQVQKNHHAYWQPALMRCDCGQLFELHSSWAEECPKCGAEYNGSGQRLASRSQWGEETGETFASRNWSNDEEGA